MPANDEPQKHLQRDVDAEPHPRSSVQNDAKKEQADALQEAPAGVQSTEPQDGSQTGAGRAQQRTLLIDHGPTAEGKKKAVQDESVATAGLHATGSHVTTGQKK